MKAIITCAGMGKRLLPITKEIPKCMVKILDKLLIQYTIDNLCKCDIDEVIIVDNYKKEILEEYLSSENIPIKITYITQEIIDGTANAVYSTRNNIDNNFIVLAGDTIYKVEDIKKLIKNTNSVLYTRKNKINKIEYGTLEIKNGFITRIAEKVTPVSNLVNCNGYNFTIDVFDYIEKTPYDDRFNEKIITNTINLMIMYGYKFSGIEIESLDEISRIDDIKKLEEKIKDEY